MLSSIIEQVFRREGGRVLAGLIRYTGDFDLAEDALQDAFARALNTWPREGLPDRPAAWLSTVARRRAVDLIRRKKRAPLSHEQLPEPASEAPDMIESPAEISGVEDDRLRLLFTCCHPALAQSAQAALALRTLCGLSTREIARAFIESEVTTAQRLVRAKNKIREAGIPYEVPKRDDLPERLETVLAVVYLVFNEGYSATESEAFLRPDLCQEAIRLGRLLAELMPDEPEAKGLLALMLLHDSRRETRLNADDAIVPLEEQDRSRWNREAIREGIRTLDEAIAFRHPGPYQIQAAVASLHAQAATPEATDWPQISALYGALYRHTPTAVVELNAAVALALASHIDKGLDWIASIERRGELKDYYLLPAAKADLLRRCGRKAEAIAAYRTALDLVRAPAERKYLERRLAEL